MNLEELEQLFHVNPDELMKMMADTLGPDATQEDVEAAVMEMMANVGKMISQPYTLRDCLSYLTKEDLIEVAKTLKLSGYSKLRKEELQQHLHNTLTDPKFMMDMYPALTNGEIEILKQLCVLNIPLISTDIMFCTTELLRHGLCYLDEYGKHLVIPEELKELFLTADRNPVLQAKQKENGILYDFCNTAVYFCGVYPMADLCDRIQKVLHRPITEQELIQWHAKSLLYREEFFFKNGYIVATALQQTPEDIIALQQIQKMKKQIFWPDAETMDILSIEQWLIAEKLYEPFWDMAPILMDNEFGDVMSVSRFVEASIRTGAPFDALMGFLSEQIFAFDSIEEIDAFAEIMQNIWNNTPMWENCGYSPNQMKALQTHKNTAQKNSVNNRNASNSNVISLAERRARKNK